MRMSSDETPVICGALGLYMPSFIGIVMSHYYASYEPISILECHKSSIVLERRLLQ